MSEDNSIKLLFRAGNALAAAADNMICASAHNMSERAAALTAARNAWEEARLTAARMPDFNAAYAAR
jgi:hypothetical protein